MEKITKNFVQSLLTNDSRIDEQLQRHLPLTVYINDKPTKYQRVIINSETGSGKSQKFQNLVINLPLLLKIVCETVIDGIHSIHIPALVIPSLLKLIISTKEAISKDLTEVQTSILIGLFRLTNNSKDKRIKSDDLFDESSRIYAEMPYNAILNKDDFQESINYLEKFKCLESDEENMIKMKERIIIN